MTVVRVRSLTLGCAPHVWLKRVFGILFVRPQLDHFFVSCPHGGSRLWPVRTTAVDNSTSSDNSTDQKRCCVMVPSDTPRTVDQNHLRPYGKQQAVAAQQKEVAAGWRQLKRIRAAQHLAELSNVSSDQIADVGAACMSLLFNSSDSSVDPPLPFWTNERQQQLDLLLRAAGKALALYTAARACGQQCSAQAYNVLVILLMCTSDVLDTFNPDSTGQQRNGSGAVVHSPDVLRCVLQPALPGNRLESTGEAMTVACCQST